MNNNSRTRNSIINIIFNFGQNILLILLSFFSRRVFIESLGIEYLGVTGLFNNIKRIICY